MTEQEAREYISKLKGFYRTAFAYLILNLLIILVWLLIGEDYFWPGWILLISVGYLINQAIQLNLLPSLNDLADKLFGFCPEFSPEWEEEQIRKLVDQETPPSSGPSSSKNEKTKQSLKKFR